jgi:DNA-directed RNA polymerase subunit N (RpoN/RPB10)
LKKINTIYFMSITHILDQLNEESYILLPVRCYTCQRVLGHFQDEYERFILEKNLTFNEIMMRFGINRECCKANMLSPPILPYDTRPTIAISSDRFTINPENRPKHIFTTKTFSDVSQKKNTFIEKEDYMELEKSEVAPVAAIVETSSTSKTAGSQPPSLIASMGMVGKKMSIQGPKVNIKTLTSKSSPIQSKPTYIQSITPAPIMSGRTISSVGRGGVPEPIKISGLTSLLSQTKI